MSYSKLLTLMSLAVVTAVSAKTIPIGTVSQLVMHLMALGLGLTLIWVGFRSLIRIMRGLS